MEVQSTPIVKLENLPDHQSAYTCNQRFTEPVGNEVPLKVSE